MKQLILPSDYSGESIYTLNESDSHYLLKVQRREIGYTLSLMDKNGTRYMGKIIDIENNLCTLQLKKESDVEKSPFKITLFQAIPKGKKIDLMIRQSVEAGVFEFVPIQGDHSIPVFDNEKDKAKKRDRWEKIIKEASQQSGTSGITRLASIKSLKDAIRNLEEPYTGIFFHQVPMQNRPLHQLLETPSENIVLVIGPEGGLSAKEVELLMEHNFSPALLGPNILRAETATTFSLGAVEMILLEKDSWLLKK